jgi:hypothetical protein
MSNRSPHAVQDRIAKLQREIQALQLGSMMKKLPAALPKLRRPGHRTKRTRVNYRPGRVTIARGINLTTLPGSLYSTALKVYAARGHLDQHDALFASFEKKQTPESALALLKKIGVAREELDPLIRVDEEFQRHCDEETEWYQHRAAAGDGKAKSILTDRKIFNERGRWVGDIDEAVRILRGARTLKQVRRGRNQRILNRARMMFDALEVGGMELGFLFRQRQHRVFRQAVRLAQSLEENIL